MDRTTISALAHADHPVASPLDDDTVSRLLDRALTGRRSMLDLGCGSGVWLLRALSRDPQLRAVGVDHVDAGFARTEEQAQRAGVATQLELHRSDVRTWTSSERFELVLSIGATHAFGGLDQTLTAARTHLQPGGYVLIGECFWERTPDSAALGHLGAELQDYDDLAGTVQPITAAGWVPVHAHVSTPQEWDAYEWSWTGSLAQWSLDHPDDPDHHEVLKVADEHRRAWLEGYRHTLGFITLLLAPHPEKPSSS